ncbi:hypothetical protein BGW80DRAFT_1272218 [Lactifluus volemus]|nr:hypothetical protein BGW80DRAFT_1272218 [Lactifluus volemus]
MYTLPHLGPRDFSDISFTNDLLDPRLFDADLPSLPPVPVVHPHDWSQYLVGQGATTHPTILNAPPPPIIHPTVAPQFTSDGTYPLLTHPSASFPTGSSSALFGSGEKAAVSGISQVPMPSGPALAASAFASSLARPMVPVSGPSICAPTSPSIVLPWNADATTASAAGAGASAPRVQRRAPIDRCRCCRRAHPFVRIYDTIEWVRPDVMKMIVYFNWSLNAEQEAPESWEPRRE